MKKQSGFTLVELMVVMAIIAILATAGITAYSGYISKARDTDRLADIKAIETMIIGEIATTGKPPISIDALETAIKNANGGAIITDSVNGTACWNAPVAGAAPVAAACGYYYALCDGGVGYMLSTRFENKSNIVRYGNDNFNAANYGINSYDVGNCTAIDTAATNYLGATNEIE